MTSLSILSCTHFVLPQCIKSKRPPLTTNTHTHTHTPTTPHTTKEKYNTNTKRRNKEEDEENNTPRQQQRGEEEGVDTQTDQFKFSFPLPSAPLQKKKEHPPHTPPHHPSFHPSTQTKHHIHTKKNRQANKPKRTFPLPHHLPYLRYFFHSFGIHPPHPHPPPLNTRATHTQEEISSTHHRPAPTPFFLLPLFLLPPTLSRLPPPSPPPPLKNTHTHTHTRHNTKESVLNKQTHTNKQNEGPQWSHLPPPPLPTLSLSHSMFAMFPPPL